MTRARSALPALPALVWRLRAAGVAMVAAALFASPAGAQSLDASIAPGVPFPGRTLVLTVPNRPALTAANVHVIENGRAVNALNVIPLSHANVGDFGVVVVIDSDPSMGGANMANAMAAARALAAQRTGQQELGVVFSGGNGTVALPLTSDPQAISRALVNGPRIGGLAHLLPALALAIRELASANIASGAVILVSDDIDTEPGLTPQSVAALASAAHVRIYTVGVRDRDFTPLSMGLLAQAGGGQFFEANPAQLSGIFTRIDSVLTSRYVLHYRSTQPLGAPVDLTVRVDGVPGSFATTYAPPSPLRAPTKAAARHQSFWASALGLVLVAAGCALLIGVAVVLLLSHFVGTRPVTTRVSEFIAPPVEPLVPLSGVVVGAAFGRTEKALTTRSWWPAFVEDVDIARMGRSAVELAYLAVVGSCVIVALLVLVSGSLLTGIPGLFVGPMLLRLAVNYRVRRQRALFADQLPTHMEEVASAMRSGRSILEALAVASESAEEPTRREFERALADERLGRPLEDTLRPIAQRMNADGMEQFAVVAAMHRRTGSSVAEVLDRVAEGARDRAELQRELLALTAQGRLARWILTAMPPVMLFLFSLIDPLYEHPMFHTTGGLMALGVGTVMVVMGSLVMKRIVEIEV